MQNYNISTTAKIGRFRKRLAEGLFVGLIIGSPILLYGLGWIKG